MGKFYRDYFWKEGIPYGIEPTEDGGTVKIVMDPYRKRISIEKYQDRVFAGVIYDSALFNFRHLKPAEQNAWQKNPIRQDDNSIECLIRNQDDRVVIKEVYRFEKGVCRECFAYSPQGILISRQHMLYTALQDPLNGVILYDANEHPVVFKKYAISEETGEFTDLLEEQWDMKKKQNAALLI